MREVNFTTDSYPAHPRMVAWRETLARFHLSLKSGSVRGELYGAVASVLSPNGILLGRVAAGTQAWTYEADKPGAMSLALHLEGLAADGEAAPEPSSLEEIMKEAQNKDGVAVLIAAPASEVKSVRINVTMPADVLDQIDRYAEREGFTRSGFLAQAAKKAMAV